MSMTPEALDTLFGALDCGGFITGFTIAAQAHGVASIAQAAVASYAPFLHGYFDIPEGQLILCAGLDDFVDWRG